MQRKARMSSHRGFSLIELMTVVAIVGVIAAMAAPSFSQMLKAQKVKTLAEDLYVDLTLARSESIKRKVLVSLVPRDSASAKDWAKGWDLTSTQLVGTTNTPITIKSKDATPDDTSAIGTGVGTIVFGSAGRLSGGTATLSIQVKQSDLASSSWRCVSVDVSGRAASKAGSCT